MFYSSYEPKFIKHMITVCDVFCIRNNVFAMLYPEANFHLRCPRLF